MAKIVSFSLTKDTLDLLEQAEKKFSFKNRSELVRSALLGLLHEAGELEKLKSHTSAIIAVIHRQRYEDEISRIKHQFDDIIATQIHQNLHEACLELFVAHGKAETIVQFFKALKQSRNVEYAKLTSTTL